MRKQAKKVCSFRLSEITKHQIANMVDAEMSEGEVIECHKQSLSRTQNPALPDIKHSEYSLD